jgi:hypothetical protein
MTSQSFGRHSTTPPLRPTNGCQTFGNLTSTPPLIKEDYEMVVQKYQPIEFAALEPGSLDLIPLFSQWRR